MNFCDTTCLYVEVMAYYMQKLKIAIKHPYLSHIIRQLRNRLIRNHRKIQHSLSFGVSCIKVIYIRHAMTAVYLRRVNLVGGS